MCHDVPFLTKFCSGSYVFEGLIIIIIIIIIIIVVVVVVAVVVVVVTYLLLTCYLQMLLVDGLMKLQQLLTPTSFQ